MHKELEPPLSADTIRKMQETLNDDLRRSVIRGAALRAGFAHEPDRLQFDEVIYPGVDLAHQSIPAEGTE